MKKRTAALILALMLGVSLGLTGCTGGTDTPSPTPVETTEVPPTDTVPAESVAPTETPGQATDDPGDSTGDQDESLTVEIEGTTEVVPGIRHNSWLGYAMTYDPAIFTMTQVDETSDSYMAELVEGRPNVYLSVSIIEDLTFDEAVEGMRLQKGIEETGKTVSMGAHSYAATYLRYAAGTGGNDEVTEYYVTEQNGTIFLVALGNFVDGEEGYGARLHAMLNTMTF